MRRRRRLLTLILRHENNAESSLCFDMSLESERVLRRLRLRNDNVEPLVDAAGSSLLGRVLEKSKSFLVVIFVFFFFENFLLFSNGRKISTVRFAKKKIQESICESKKKKKKEKLDSRALFRRNNA
jgi:hypothetical protein